MHSLLPYINAVQALCNMGKSSGVNVLLCGVGGVSASHSDSVVQQPILLVRLHFRVPSVHCVTNQT